MSGRRTGGRNRQGSRTVHRRRMTRQRRRQQLIRRSMIVLCIAFLCIISLIFLCKKLFFSQTGKNIVQETEQIDWTGAPELDVELLDVNEYSRPGTALKQVNGIVIHYTANPGSSAMANRDYFEGLKDAHTTKASSHFIVGLEGEVVQCIPTTEIAYASNERNGDTISIECCHPDDTGAFNTATYQSMVQLTAWLCNRFGLTSQDVIRHYDVTGKICPKYFVEHEDAWEQFKEDVQQQIGVLAS